MRHFKFIFEYLPHEDEVRDVMDLYDISPQEQAHIRAYGPIEGDQWQVVFP